MWLFARSVLAFGALVALAANAGRVEAPPASAVTYPRIDLPPRAFPIRTKPGASYLVDGHGEPFYLNGDAAWSLIGELSDDDVERYLEDRRARGFNTILVSLIEHRFSSHPPNDHDGRAPFLRPGDFSSPNEAYFAHAEQVIARAEAKGILVLLAPAYLGADGGNDGWYGDMVANGPEKLKAYGRYVATRMAARHNIIWVNGGDFSPPRRDLVEAIASGIYAVDPAGLQTAHLSPDVTALAFWPGARWLGVDTVYTYGPLADGIARLTSHPNRLPFVMIESRYEFEEGATALRVRTQAYQTLLSGAAGHVFGNNPVWHFTGIGVFPAPMSWQQALDSPGSRSMTILMQLVAQVDWWKLHPQPGLISTGAGEGQKRAVTAASDRVTLVYVPSPRVITLDASRLGASRLWGRWFDPTNGQYGPRALLEVKRGRVEITPQDANSAGDPDWVLVLDAADAEQPSQR